MNKKEMIENSIKALELAGISRQELNAYLLKKKRFEVSYEIVYVDDSVSTEHIVGKEMKGVIFKLEGKDVFVSARYAPRRMSKTESKKYCASVYVKGKPCTEGRKECWEKGGLLNCYHEEINFVLDNLGLDRIDDRIIWSSSVYDEDNNTYWLVYPDTGDTVWNYDYSCKYVRPVRLLS